MALSQDGLFSKTQEAADKYKQAQEDEEEALTELEKQLEGYADNNPSPSTPTEPTPTEPTPTPKEIPLVTTFTTFTNENKEAKDSLGNLITIPKGFKFLEGDTVKEGIVIQDKDGNEFVWIPVSNIDGDNDATNGSSKENQEDLISIDGSKKVEITLGRYTFDASNGTPHLEQRGSECGESNHVISTYYTEYVSQVRANGGVGAKDLQGFVDSVKKNHGYYIARYEAGVGTNSKPVSKRNVAVWNKITEANASSECLGMYAGSDFTSDLINSYAWDTAIVYIQAMENKNYANANCETNNNYNQLKNTGETGDEKCHIFDMAGNVMEWTTEYSTYTDSAGERPCLSRGGNYNFSNYHTASRGYRTTADSVGSLGFRPLLYLK